MKYQPFALAFLALTGCTQVTTTIDTTKHTSTTRVTLAPQLAGGYLQLGSDGTLQGDIHTGDNLTTLHLDDGESLPLTTPLDSKIIDRNHYRYGDHTYNRFVVSGGQYRASKFGFVDTPEQTIFFAQGWKTPDMPQTGTAIYEGDSALNLLADALHPRPFSGIGSFVAAVDFARQTIDAQVNPVNDEPHLLHFTGQITGNTFHSNEPQTVFQGGFYGTNAAEIGGYFQRDGNYGAFGGHKH